MCCLFLLDIFYKCSPVLSKLSCSVLFLASRLRDFDLKEATRLGRRPSSGTVSPILLIKIFNIRWKGFFLSPENLMNTLSSSSYEIGFGKGLHSTSTEIIVRQEPPTQTQTSIYRETLNSAKSWRGSLIPKRKISFVVFVEIELCASRQRPGDNLSHLATVARPNSSKCSHTEDKKDLQKNISQNNLYFMWISLLVLRWEILSRLIFAVCMFPPEMPTCQISSLQSWISY